MSKQNEPADTHVPEDDGNFMHVVIYAGIFLVLGLIVAFVIIKGVGRRIVPGRHDPHPTSQLMLPAAESPAILAQTGTEFPFIPTQQKHKTCV